MRALRHHVEADRLVLTPDGGIDATDVPVLLDTVARLLAEEQQATVVLDLSLLGDPGLPALDTVARMHLVARRSGRPLHVRHAPPALRRVWDRTGLSELFPLPTTCCRACEER